MSTLVEVTTPPTIALKFRSTTTWALLLLEPKDTRGFELTSVKVEFVENGIEPLKEICIKVLKQF